MKRLIAPVLLLALGMALAVIGCSKKNPTSAETPVNDNAAIAMVLGSSGYADVSDYGDDGSAALGSKDDIFPAYIRWRRRVTPSAPVFSIQLDSSNTFATVTITRDFTGYFVVDNTNNAMVDTIVRPVHDHGVRYVWLRKINSRWRIWGASPMDIATVSPATAVTIDSVRVTGSSGPRPSVLFAGTVYTQTMRRELMPVFDPGASVTIRVYGSIAGASYPADSVWAFLHRRVYNSNGWYSHLRWAMDRVAGQPFVFTKSWTIADDSISVRPALRQSCVDMILGSALFDTAHASPKPYSARLWTMPYIVVNNADDSLPE